MITRGSESGFGKRNENDPTETTDGATDAVRFTSQAASQFVSRYDTWNGSYHGDLANSLITVVSDILKNVSTESCFLGCMNNSDNGTHSGDGRPSVGLLIPVGVLLSFLSILTFVGNAMVLQAIRTEKRLQTVIVML